jgi:hypothetical protein
MSIRPHTPARPFRRPGIRPQRILLPLILSGCAHQPPPSMPDNPLCTAPAGTPDQQLLRPGVLDLYGYTVELAAPQVCGTSAYFELKGSGRRNRPTPQPPLLCVGRPDRTDPCNQVPLQALGEDIVQVLRNRGIQVNGLGLGACGTAGPPFQGWNFGIGVSDWKDVDQAIQITVDRMRAWDYGGTFGVSVRPIACGVEL